jgi:hypothetical protein
MNTVKYYAELTLAPLLFVAYLLVNIKTAVNDAAQDTMSAVSDTRYKYGRR